MTAPSRVLLLRTVSSDSDFNGDLDLGVVEVTSALAHIILERHRQVSALAEHDHQFHSACWFDCSCVFGSADREGLENLDEDGWRLVDTVDGLGIEEQRTEADVMHIDEKNAWWSCTPRHCDITVETMPVPISVFAAVVAQLAQRAHRAA